jgi:hypothetical protein
MANVLKQGLGEKVRKVPSISIPDFVVRLFAVRVKRLRPSTLRQAIEMTHAVTDSSV